jgi:hypothetical protein
MPKKTSPIPKDFYIKLDYIIENLLKEYQGKGFSKSQLYPALDIIVNYNRDIICILRNFPDKYQKYIARLLDVNISTKEYTQTTHKAFVDLSSYLEKKGNLRAAAQFRELGKILANLKPFCNGDFSFLTTTFNREISMSTPKDPALKHKIELEFCELIKELSIDHITKVKTALEVQISQQKSVDY